MKYLCLLLLLPAGLSAAEPLKVTRGNLQPNLILTGRIKAKSAETLNAPITRAFQLSIDWMVPEGQKVTPGAVVVRFNNKQDRQMLAQSEQELINKRLNYQNQEETKRDRLQQLAQDLESAQLDVALSAVDARIPADLQKRKEYEEKQLAHQKARNQLELKKQQIAIDTQLEENNLKQMMIEIHKLEEEIRQQREAVENLALRTRNGGVVIYGENREGSRKLAVGDTVYQGATVVTIPNLATMELETWLTEQEWVQVSPGQTVKVRLDAYPDRLLTGSVRSVSEQAKPREQWSDGVYYHVLIELDQTDLSFLKPGMSAQTEIQLKRFEGVWLIPLQAVQFAQDGYRIFPNNSDPVAVTPLAWDAFHLAVDGTAPLREGLVLQIAPGGAP